LENSAYIGHAMVVKRNKKLGKAAWERDETWAWKGEGSC